MRCCSVEGVLRVVLCAGGTGGHMFPACALFESLQKAGEQVSIVTDKRGDVFCSTINDKIVLDTVRFSYSISVLMSFLRIALRLMKIWRKRPPQVIVSFGGVLTFIPVLVAKIFGAKVVVYEQNSVVGEANSVLSRIANCRISTFDLGKDWIQVAPPIRKEFVSPREYSCDGKIKILIIGGSQGASSFSKILPAAFAILTEQERSNIEIVQQVGKPDGEQLAEVYSRLGIQCKLLNFIDNVSEVMSESQLVICRAGASTLSELSAVGRPAILIPLPKSAQNHQFLNALSYQQKQAAWVFEEKSGIEQLIAKKIREVLMDRELLKNAASHMIETLIGHEKTIEEIIKQVGNC